MGTNRQKPVLGNLLDYSNHFASDLLTCWMFNNSSGSLMHDISHNGVNGTISNATWGTDGLIIADTVSSIYTNAAVYPTTAITLTARFELTWSGNSPQARYIFGHESPFFLLGWITAGGASIYCYTDGTLRGTYVWEPSAGVDYIISLVTGVNDLYVNGKYLTTFNDGTQGTLTGNIYWGDRWASANQSLGGTFKTVMVHNHAMQPNEIKILHSDLYQMFSRSRITRYAVAGAAPPASDVVVPRMMYNYRRRRTA